VSDTPTRLVDRGAELRVAFDRSFAQPARTDAAGAEGLLAIRTGPQASAIRLSEIAGLFAGKKITPLPSHLAALLGIAGFRGAMMPVYDLGMLLGHPASEAPRWLVICLAAPVALAFEAFDGHLLVSRDGILPEETTGRARTYVRGFVRANDVIRPIVHLPSVLDAIREQAPGTAPREER
jgi:chemotaxis signal transduction protein